MCLCEWAWPAVLWEVSVVCSTGALTAQGKGAAGISGRGVEPVNEQRDPATHSSPATGISGLALALVGASWWLGASEPGGTPAAPAVCHAGQALFCEPAAPDTDCVQVQAARAGGARVGTPASRVQDHLGVHQLQPPA